MKELFDLAGKKAIVTGGTRGIGKAIAIKLSKVGYDIAINYRKERSLIYGICQCVFTSINV